MENALKIAIVSDLHAYDEHTGGAAPSHLRITDPEDQPGKHPIAGLLKLIEDKQLSADLLLCPGDLAHQAKPAPIKYAWQALQKLKLALSARRIIATAGNHDLDSRHIHNLYDAKGLLQSLVPAFPFDDDALNDRFWAKNFAIISENGFNMVVVNSSAYHGAAPDEIDHGRIADSTVSSLRQKLETMQPAGVNILLCHHHPQTQMELGLGERDVMKGGQLLLDLLGAGSFGRWLVVHGHKHHPKLTYASGSATSPIIFSAGSLSAALYKDLAAVVRNQFYMLSIPMHSPASRGLTGMIQAWDWTPGLGWSPATANSGLPAICGFGFRGDPAELADRIRNALKTEKLAWAKLKSMVPEVDYVMPQDFATLRAELRKLGLVIQDLDGLPYEIGRSFES